MDVQRLRTGEKLAGAGGLGLLVSTFLPWYAEGRALSAWEAFSVFDLLLAVTALMGVVLAVLAATQRAPALPVATSVLLIALSFAVLLLAVYKLLDQPGTDDSVEVRLGAYLGLGCLLLVAVGGWRSLTDERAYGPAGARIPPSPAPPKTSPIATPGRAGDPRAP